MNIKKIYKRVYDNSYNKDGSLKKNELLGIFEIKQQLSQDDYSELFIGIRQEDNKMYLIEGFEIDYVGSGYEIYLLDESLFNK